MKRIFVYIALIFSFSSSSCEKEIMDYEGSEGVYFAVQHGMPSRADYTWSYQPYSEFNFSKIVESETLASIKVMITGPAKDYDRVLKVEVNPDSTTAILGTHYKNFPQEWTIPADAISTFIQIPLLLTPDLETMTKTLGLRLVPTSDLGISFPKWDSLPHLNGGTVVASFDASLHTIHISDILAQPAVWIGSIQSGNRESGSFGAFTRKKMEFITEYLGVSYEEFASAETMPLARTNLIARNAAEILTERYEANDPILEADGRLMFFSGVAWTSYIGVPYIPRP